MRKTARNLAIALVGLALFQAATARACSVVRDYRIPTNLQLVERADLIVLATVGAPLPSVGDAWSEGRLSVEPKVLLKGDALPASLEIPGSIAEPRFAIPSNPDELELAHPIAYMGGCVRDMFIKGSTLLLFFERGADGRPHMISDPFSRVAEDVPTAESRWVKAVKLYVEVAGLPEQQRTIRLQALERELAKRVDDADALAISADISRQLSGKNEPSDDRWNELEREFDKFEARGG